MAKLTRYKNMGLVGIPFENTSENWVVVIGANFNTGDSAVFTSKQNLVLLEVEGPNEEVLDTYQIQANGYIADPASGAVLVHYQLTKIYRVPPSGSANSPSSIITGLQLIECMDTSQIDGKDSLENALAIK